VTITRLIGVYDADGGLLGEASYVWGKLRGVRHCGLCDVTDSAVRRKPSWDALVSRLGIPFELLHLNELPDEVRQAIARWGAPAVLGAGPDGLELLLDATALELVDGSVWAFERALGDRVSGT